MKVTVLAALFLAPVIMSAPTPPSIQQQTDHLLFDIPLGEFIAIRNSQPLPPGLDWTADGCSTAPDELGDFEFLNACTRHDFGYRNYKAQERCGHADRKRVDKNFKKDLYAECAKEDKQDVCELVADGYYSGVRVFGASSC